MARSQTCIRTLSRIHTHIHTYTFRDFQPRSKWSGRGQRGKISASFPKHKGQGFTVRNDQLLIEIERQALFYGDVFSHCTNFNLTSWSECFFTCCALRFFFVVGSVEPPPKKKTITFFFTDLKKCFLLRICLSVRQSAEPESPCWSALEFEERGLISFLPLPSLFSSVMAIKKKLSPRFQRDRSMERESNRVERRNSFFSLIWIKSPLSFSVF